MGNYPNRKDALICPNSIYGHATVKPFSQAASAYLFEKETPNCIYCGVALNLGFYAHHVDDDLQRLIDARKGR